MIDRIQSRQVRHALAGSVVVVIWLASLVFSWSVYPGDNQNRLYLAAIVLSYLLVWGLIFFWSDASVTEKAGRFLLTSFSVALLVGLLECLALAKLVDFRLALGTPIWEPWRHPDNLLEPKLLHIHKPSYHTRFEGIDYRYDRHGLRNDAEYTAADVVVIGDSFIEGWKVAAGDMLTALLANQLGLTVANLGQSWYGPQQELELLRRYGVPLHPRICVWSFFEGNDLIEVHRYQKATRDWQNFSKQFHSFRERSFTKNAVLAVGRIANSWRTGESRDSTWRKWVPSGIFKESDGRNTRLFFMDNSSPLTARDSQALEQVGSDLGQASGLCRTEGAKFLVLFIPTKFRVYNAFTTFEDQPASWVISDLPKMLEAIVRKLPDAQFLDLTPVLTDEARRGSLTYFPGLDSHWSPTGNRVAATAIAQFLRQWK
jgi:hypothetical protein